MTSAPSPAKWRPSGRSSMPSISVGARRALGGQIKLPQVDHADPAHGPRGALVHAVQAVRLAVGRRLRVGVGHAQVTVVRSQGDPHARAAAWSARMLASNDAWNQAL